MPSRNNAVCKTFASLLMLIFPGAREACYDYLSIHCVPIIDELREDGTTMLQIDGMYGESAWGVDRLTEHKIGETLLLKVWVRFCGNGTFRHRIVVDSSIARVLCGGREIWNKANSFNVEKHNAGNKEPLLWKFSDSGGIKLEVFYRKPEVSEWDKDLHVDGFVLFGKEKQNAILMVEDPAFCAMADKYHMFMFAPQFNNGISSAPDLQMAEVLDKALEVFANESGFKIGGIYLYGDSTESKLMFRFSRIKPERIAAWGSHAFPVRQEMIAGCKAPGLMTYGINGTIHIEQGLSSRESSELRGSLMVKPLLGGDDLGHHVLDAARIWFESIIEKRSLEEVDCRSLEKL